MASSGQGIIFKKAWTEYAKIALMWLFLELTIILVSSVVPAKGVCLGVAAVVTMLAAYLVANARSTVLWCDDEGVWLQSGFLPWERAVYGLKWRDVEDAAYFPSLVGWLTGSYTIVVRHRFSTQSALKFTQVWRGIDAVRCINDKHAAVLAGSLKGTI